MFIKNRMLTSVSGTTDKRFINITKKAVEYYLSLIVSPRIARNIIIDVEYVKQMEDAVGYCEVSGYNTRNKPREFTIQIKKNESKRFMLMVLAHEVVHAKQFAMDELDENLTVWKGKKVPAGVDYWDTPWEIEAHGREAGMYTRFCEKYELKFPRHAIERDN